MMNYIKTLLTIASISLVASGLISLTINGKQRVGIINHVYPEHGKPVVIKYDFQGISFNRVLFQRLEREMYDQTIFDSYNKTTMKKYLPDNFKVNYSSVGIAELTIDKFTLGENGTYCFTTYMNNNTLYVLNYFVLHYRKFISFNPITIDHTNNSAMPRVYDFNKDTLQLNINKQESLGVVYNVLDVGDTYNIELKSNGYDITSLFTRIEIESAGTNKYNHKSALYVLLDIFKTSQCMFQRSKSKLSISLEETTGMKVSKKNEYRVQIEGKGSNHVCQSSTKIKTNGIYQRNVLRCVHYLRGEYLHSIESGNVAINFYVRNGNDWKGLGYFYKVDDSSRQVTLDMHDIVHGEFWTDFVFPAGHKDVGEKYMCEVLYDRKRLILEELHLKYIHGDTDFYELDSTNNKEMMDDYGRRILTNAVENVGFGPMLLVVLVLGVVLVAVMSGRRSPGNKKQKAGKEEMSQSIVQDSYRQEESDKGGNRSVSQYA